MNKAHVEHLVGFVQNQVAGGRQVNRAALHQVDEATRRGDKDINAAVQDGDLLVDRLATDNCGHLDPRAAGQGFQAVRNLVHQLAGRGKDQRLAGLRIGLAGLRQQVVDQRKAKGQRLAGAGLGKAKDIVTFQRQGDGLVLNWGRVFKAEGLEVVIQLFGEAEHVKIEHNVPFLVPELNRQTGMQPRGMRS